MSTLELTVDGPAGPRTVRVSNPDRVVFPARGITKAEVVRYVVAVGDGALRALRERPTTLERWPAGVQPGFRLAVWKGRPGDAFFQRRVPRGAPAWVQTVRVESPDGSAVDSVCPTEVAVLAWAANLGTLTFHPWPVRRAHLDRPDQLLVDLDPQPGTGFAEAVEVARELRALLAELGMEGLPKTSGARGLHVIVPVAPHWGFADVQRARVALGAALVRRMPRLATSAWHKHDRGARVYVDCTPPTVAAAYSVRPVAAATVSAPLRWDELDDAAPDDLDVRTMPPRFAAVGDLHAGVDEPLGSIEALLEMADRDDSGHGRDRAGWDGGRDRAGRDR